MTTPQHMAHGYLIGYLLFRSHFVAFWCGLVAGLPDIFGELDKLKICIMQNPITWSWFLTYERDKNEWGWYLFWHNPIGIYKLFWLIPPIALHLLIDKYWHKEEGGWYSWGLKAEIVGWIICIFVGYLLFWS